MRDFGLRGLFKDERSEALMRFVVGSGLAESRPHEAGDSVMESSLRAGAPPFPCLGMARASQVRVLFEVLCAGFMRFA